MAKNVIIFLFSLCLLSVALSAAALDNRVAAHFFANIICKYENDRVYIRRVKISLSNGQKLDTINPATKIVKKFTTNSKYRQLARECCYLDRFEV
jgi:hypothetical protein